MFEHIARDTAEKSVMFTGAFANVEGDGDRGAFEQIAKLARWRSLPLIAVVLDCSDAENERRLQAPGRRELHKLTRPAVLHDMRARFELLRPNSVPLIELDVTALTAAQAATEIHSEIAKLYVRT